MCEGYWTLKHTMMVKTSKLNSRLLRMGIYAVHIMHCVLRTHVPSMRTSSPPFYDFFSHKKSCLFYNDGFPYIVYRNQGWCWLDIMRMCTELCCNIKRSNQRPCHFLSILSRDPAKKVQRFFLQILKLPEPIDYNGLTLRENHWAPDKCFARKKACNAKWFREKGFSKRLDFT